MITGDFLRSRRRRDLSEDERAALEAAVSEVVTLPRRQTIVHRGDKVSKSTMLLSGMMCRYMDARDGQRQLVALQVPGDFVDLHGFPLQRLDHDVATLTEVTVAYVPHERLTRITEEFPHLGRMLWFSTLLDAAMHREWIFRIGRLGALGRIAHLLCETECRLRAVGRSTEGRFELALVQQDIAEACGLTSVHVNRMLRELREMGLVTVGDGEVHVHDLKGLARVAEFEPDYLYLEDHLHTP